MRKTKLVVFFSLLLLIPLSRSAVAAYPEPRPKLVVMLVVDQFRADYLPRFESRFLPAKGPGGKLGGYKYLMTQGAYFPWAQYDILQSMTAPGHSTILTGAYPYQARIPINEWFNRETQQRMYCVEDPMSPPVSEEAGTSPLGLSPRNLAATTVGDELKNAGLPSRVVSISLKDRAAILMGGHRADIALWLDQKSFQWISSRFYFPDGKLPEWVRPLNQELAAQKGKSLDWSPTDKGTGYSESDSMALPDAWNAGRIGKNFPHHAVTGTVGAITVPYGLEITENAAEKAMDAYQLGKGRSPDLLAVSFSSHDYAGHVFGPNSREMEEMTVAEDRVIAKFLNFLSHRVPGGLANVVIVLTGDHGIPPNPELAQSWRYDSGRIDEKALSDAMEVALDRKFGKPDSGKWVPFYAEYNFALNQNAIAQKKLDRAEVEAVAKEEALKHHGVDYVLTRTEYEKRNLPPGVIARQILHTYVPSRSGDLVLITKPYYQPLGDSVGHVTGYNYDRTVPLALAGLGIRPGVHSEHAEVIDIAPTLSYLLGILPPDMSEGRVLTEALKP